MAKNILISKFGGYWRVQCRLFTTTRAASSVKLTVVSNATANARPFEEMPKLIKNPKRRILKSIINLIFGKHKKNFRRDLYFEKAFQKYGPIVNRGELFGPSTVHLFDPRDVETVFRNEDSSPYRISFETIRLARECIRDVFPKRGIGESNGDEWYALRKKFQGPMLRVKNVDNLCPQMDTVADEFVNNVQDLINNEGEIEDIIQELYKWAIESIGLVVFDRHLGAMNKSLSSSSDTFKLTQAMKDTLAISYKYDLGLPWATWFKTPSFRKLIKAQRFVAEMAMQYITLTLDRIKNLQADEIEKSSFLLQMLFRQEVDLEDVVLLTTDILIGGIDTSSHSSAMVMYHLARNQSVQDKLYDEIKKVLPDPDTVITSAHLYQLPYLKACIKETHRITPVVDAVSRVLKKDLVLSGFNVPSGTNVIIHHRTMCRLHFEDPTQFKPERWLQDGDGSRKNYQFVFLPFGHGSRACIGRRIAEQEIQLLITRMLQKYHLTYNSNKEITLLSQVVNIPDGPLRIKFNQRPLGAY